MLPISVVMVFRNEGIQVEKTIDSINNSIPQDQEIDIVVVNDNSDDRNYSYLSKLPNVRYFENKVRLGSSLGKEYAVQLAKYENVLLIDAHMRFIDKTWSLVIEQYLTENDKKIYCLYTIGFEERTEKIKDYIHYGCYMTIEDKQVLCNKWARSHYSMDNCIDIAGIMGAAYFFKKFYWNYLKGYQGLKLYGREEEYISIKSWAMGDGCALIKNCKIAHLYRLNTPYKMDPWEIWHNILVICYTLLPDGLQERIINILQKKNIKVYKKVLSSINFSEIRNLKKYYQSNNFDINKFLDINKKVLSANNVVDTLI